MWLEDTNTTWCKDDQFLLHNASLHALDTAIRSDDQPGEGGVLQGQTQPGFRRELKCSACKVSRGPEYL